MKGNKTSLDAEAREKQKKNPQVAVDAEIFIQGIESELPVGLKDQQEGDQDADKPHVHLHQVVDPGLQCTFLFSFENDQQKRRQRHHFPGGEKRNPVAHAHYLDHRSLQPDQAKEVERNLGRALLVEIRFQVTGTVNDASQAGEIDQQRKECTQFVEYKGGILFPK